MDRTKFLWILSLNVVFLIGSVTATDGSIAASSVTGVVADLDAVNTTALHLTWDSPTKNPNITIERYEIEVDNVPRVKIPSDNETSSYNYTITGLNPGVNYSVVLIVVYTQEIEATTVAQETTQEIETTTVAQATTTVTVLETSTTSALTTQSTVLSTASVASELRDWITREESIYLFNNTYPETPTGIIRTGRDTHSLTFTWYQEGKADACYMWTDDATTTGTDCSFHSNGSATGTISGLPVAGKEYTVHIVSVSGGLNSSSEVSTAPERTLPPNPSAPQCISQTNTSFTFMIPPPFNYLPDSFELDQYEVIVLSTNILFLFNTTRLVDVANQSSEIQMTINDVGIVAGVTYGITLISWVADVSSADSSSSNCVTEPNVPIINGIIETTEVMVKATWQAPSGYFDGFNVSCVGQNSAKNDFAIKYQNQTSSGTSEPLSADCHNVTAGALYEVNIVSILLNQSLTSKASDSVSNVTVPYAPTKVEPTNATTTNFIQLSVAYEYDESVSQCTHFEVSNFTETVTVEKIPASDPTVTFEDLTPDSRYNFNTSAISNYTQHDTQLNSTLWRRSSNSTPTIAWTLAPSVSNITGLERRPWSLYVQFDQTVPHEHVWKYTIHVDDASGRIKTIDLICDGATDEALTTLNCDPTNPDVETKIDCKTMSSCDATTAYPESTQGVAVVTTVTDVKTTTTKMPEDVTTSTKVARLLEDRAAQSICFNISDLQPYINYSISVQAVNPGGCSVKESVALVTEQSIPGCVNINSSRAGYYSIDVYWNPPDKPNGIITQYVINYTRHDGTSDTYMMTTEDTFCTIQPLDPYVEYNITVVAETSLGVGASSGCPLSDTVVKTRIGMPYYQYLYFVSISPTSINISWTLEREVETGPETYYNLTITDTKNDTWIREEHVEGFYNRWIVVDGLDEYWEYNVAIVGYTISEFGRELISVGNNENTRTQESTPGPVLFLNATSLVSMNMCYRARVAWDQPAERDRNGAIMGYKLTWSEVNGSYFTEDTYQGHIKSAEVAVEPNGKAYTFTIMAKTSVGYGTNVSYILESTGICGPAPLNVETVFGVSPDYTQTSFTVVYDSLVFNENDNGAVVASAILVAEDSINLNDTDVHGGQELFNGAIKWKDAIDVSPIPEYRPTPDGWLNDSSGSVTHRQRRELSATYIVGNDGSCSKEEAVYCNGPLQPGRNYRVRGVICTQENMCYKTRILSHIFITANADESLAWIAGVVIGILVLIVLIILLLYFLKKKRQSPYEAKDDNRRESTDLKNFRVPPQELAKPVRVIDFSARVVQMHRNSDLEFNDEYQSIQNQSARKPWTAAEKPKNRVKNRFVNILPFDHSRVTLRGTDNDPYDSESDYINANYIPTIRGIREFIACQGPLESTKDDFWQMVWEHECRVIVMLTNLKERGREKCAQYWPETQNEPSRFRNDICVDLITESTTDQYVIRKFKVWTGTQTREIFQFHFVSWPDFGVPDDPERVLSFIRMVRKYAGNNVDPPMVVHCSAGVGRTGTFIVLDRLLRELPRAETIDIFSMVLQLRENRCLMVQTEAQYVFIHDCMKLEIERTLGYNNHTYDDFDESSFNDEEIYQNAGELHVDNNLQTFAHD